MKKGIEIEVSEVLTKALEKMEKMLEILERTRASQFVCRMMIIGIAAAHPRRELVIELLRWLATSPEEAADGALSDSELEWARQEAKTLADQVLEQISRGPAH